MATPVNFTGGITAIISMILESWELPYEALSYNTNASPRTYASSNRFNLGNTKLFLCNAWALVKMVRRERPDIVHIHTSRHFALLKDLLLVALIKLAAGCKVIGHIHWAAYCTLLVGRSSLGRALQLRLLIGLYDTILLMSENIKRDISARISSAAAERFQKKARVIYNFVPFSNDTSEHRNGSQQTTFFFIGNLGPQKGVFDLLRAAARLEKDGLTEFKVVLAGPFDSPEEGKRIQDAIESLDLKPKVIITGPVSGTSKQSLFESATIFVLPSYGEGIPLAMLEAMSYSVPVIATSVGGIPEVIKDGHTGFLIRPADIEGLASAMRNLMLAPELRSEIGKRGRMRVEEYHSREQFFRELNCVYQDLIRPNPLEQSTATKTAASSRA